MPEPKFQEIGDTFRVNLYRRQITESVVAFEKADKTIEKPINELEKANKTVKKPISELEKADKIIKKPINELEKADKTVKKPISELEKADKTIKKPISELEKADKKNLAKSREKLLLNHIQEFGTISNKEARELLNLAESTTKRFLKKMVDEEKIGVEGYGKGRKYVLPSKG